MNNALIIASAKADARVQAVAGGDLLDAEGAVPLLWVGMPVTAQEVNAYARHVTEQVMAAVAEDEDLLVPRVLGALEHAVLTALLVKRED